MEKLLCLPAWSAGQSCDRCIPVGILSPHPVHAGISPIKGRRQVKTSPNHHPSKSFSGPKLAVLMSPLGCSCAIKPGTCPQGNEPRTLGRNKGPCRPRHDNRCQWRFSGFSFCSPYHRCITICQWIRKQCTVSLEHDVDAVEK